MATTQQECHFGTTGRMTISLCLSPKHFMGFGTALANLSFSLALQNCRFGSDPLRQRLSGGP